METAPPRLRWRIYYRDGRTIHSGQSSWELAPPRDLVAVAWRLNNDPPKVELGTPYYFLDGHPWRCWDATLYLRKMGVVKFGRWTSDERFAQAWHQCLEASSRKPVAKDHGSVAGGMVCSTRPAEDDDPPFQFGLFYDDGQYIKGTHPDLWQQAPSDGVLCAYYWRRINDVIVSFAMRRYTFYMWTAGDLNNTDNLEQVLGEYPLFKFGTPAFTGVDYLSQAEAIAEALKDTLNDVP